MSDESWRRLQVVRVCAKGHAAITYLAKRNEPEPLCPACAVRDLSGRLIAPPQTEPAVRPDGPWRENGK